MNKEFSCGKYALHILFIIISLGFLIPFVMIISVSLTNETVLLKEGFRLLPKRIDFSAYSYVFSNPGKIMQAYRLTTVQAILGTLFSVIAMALCAYSLSRPNFIAKRQITYFILITMLFSGGLIPSYIINTKYLGLGDSIWVYILPGMINGFQVFIFRTFFADLPISLIESAKMDGASEFTIFFRFIIPLSKPAFATIALLQLLERWNNWMTSLIYIRNEDLQTLQFLLQRILLEVELVKNMVQENMVMTNVNLAALPSESMKFALCIVVAGPMLVIFPFFQKYFTRGLTLGSVKG